jgi:hypothetical protein
MTTTTIPRASRRFHLGEPQIAGPLSIHPIFGPRSGLRLMGLHRAVSAGVSIAETGNVNLTLVHNPTDCPVLLYEGELIVGAAQNRVIDQPVLVPARTDLQVGVSCAEQGRWDVGEADVFTPSADLLDPSLRAAKRAHANRSASARPDQAAVWREVSERLVAGGVDSPSETVTDLFAARRGELDSVAAEIELRDGQLGAVTLLNGCPLALDIVGSRRVFADLHDQLVHGYALRALDTPHRRLPSAARLSATADRFLSTALAADRRWIPNVGMGDAYKLVAAPADGCSLWAGRDLVAFSAFPAGAQ